MKSSESYPDIVFFHVQFPEYELTKRGVAQLALDNFKDLHNLVKDHLNLPALTNQPKIERFDDMTLCLSWWKHIIYKAKSDELDDHISL